MNPLFDEVPVSGKKYKYGDWKEYAVHSDTEIRGFFGDYHFLSNFEMAPVYYDRWFFPSSEHAYQFAKLEGTDHELDQAASDLQNKTCREVKIWGNEINIRPYWDNMKYDIMARIVFDKFARNYNMRQKLLHTGNKFLEELNHWRDTYWGFDIRLGGANHLGVLLTKTRQFWM